MGSYRPLLPDRMRLSRVTASNTVGNVKSQRNLSSALTRRPLEGMMESVGEQSRSTSATSNNECQQGDNKYHFNSLWYDLDQRPCRNQGRRSNTNLQLVLFFSCSNLQWCTNRYRIISRTKKFLKYATKIVVLLCGV